MKRLFILLIIITVQIAFAQFGQNKVQYRAFDWKFIRSPHFDIYYYGENYPIAEFTADEAEVAYEQISKHLRWTLSKPVSIIVYNSHNDFQQTNIIWQYMVEGIGGVTELFKNRVVLPFEGSYEQFRHVIHHELVHAMVNDMVYGGNIQGIVSGQIKLRIPLWANEGLAEFLSSNWDTKADMILRDIAIHNDMPSVKYLDAYMAYKGGQSVWRFIAEKYGRESIGEILISMKKTQHAEKGFERAISLDFEGLTKKWHQYLKKEYWPDISGREELGDIAKQLTNHIKRKNYYNIAPALSPDGSKIAILSDVSGYADIYLIDAINGKTIKRLVKGNRSIDFEELKWLQPGVSWSPDGKHIVITAKSGEQDALHIINVDTGKSEKITLNLKGIFSATWSPNGTTLAFVGQNGTASDIYAYDLETEKLANLTSDIFSDSEPSWSPNGEKIVFVSDRSNATTPDMKSHDFFQSDIYTVDIGTKQVSQITHTESGENYPVWAHEKNVLFYTGDQHGVWNIYRHDLDSGESYAVTNVLTGIQQLTISNDDNLLVFAGYNKSGWDIYSVSLPLSLTPQTVPLTNYVKTRAESEFVADLRKDQKRASGVVTTEHDYSSHIFAPEYEPYHQQTEVLGDNKGAFDDTLRVSEEYIPQAYKTRFTLDIVSMNMGINTLEGAQSIAYFTWSDIMGDHQITLGTQMVMTLDNSDLYLSYAFLKNRSDWYFSGSHQTNTFAYQNMFGYLTLYKLREYGLSAYWSRPFNRFNRIESSLSYYVQSAQMFKEETDGVMTPYPKHQVSTLVPSIHWVFDNSVMGYTGPTDGLRQRISLLMSPDLANNYQFNLLSYDVRKYVRFWKYYSISGRVFLGKSTGKEPVKFMLGGLSNWLFGNGETNGEKDREPYREFTDVDDDSQDMLENIYFVDYVMPVRGSRYGERIGTNVALTNLELRFPLLFAFGTPSHVASTYLFGHVFLDMGTAWDKWEQLEQESHSIISGTGIGIKLFTPFGLLRIDTAWDIYRDGTYSRPQYYFSFGADW